MWFEPDSDPRQFLRSLWLFAQWLILGPLIGAALVALIGFIFAGVEGAKNGARMGAAFGTMGGVMATGAKVLSEWKV
jgi:uncharacterized membrane protein YedE/YeeE